MSEIKLTISAVIPYFNSDKTILRALDSVINQTERVDEIVLVNDGSEDDGYDTVRRYIEKHDKHNFIHINFKTNQGQAKARNIGVLKSKSKYIAFLDADDAWHINKNKLQLQILKKENPTLLSCKVCEFTDKIKNDINTM